MFMLCIINETCGALCDAINHSPSNIEDPNKNSIQ
jgi:hypothetical protein